MDMGVEISLAFLVDDTQFNLEDALRVETVTFSHWPFSQQRGKVAPSVSLSGGSGRAWDAPGIQHCCSAGQERST